MSFFAVLHSPDWLAVFSEGPAVRLADELRWLPLQFQRPMQLRHCAADQLDCRSIIRLMLPEQFIPTSTPYSQCVACQQFSRLRPSNNPQVEAQQRPLQIWPLLQCLPR